MVFEKERKKCLCVPVSEVLHACLHSTQYFLVIITIYAISNRYVFTRRRILFFFFFSYMQFEIVIHVQLFSLKGQSS